MSCCCFNPIPLHPTFLPSITMSSKKLRLSIVCHQTVYIAGDVIVGQVIIRNPYDELPFEDLVVVFSGREGAFRSHLCSFHKFFGS